MTQRWDELLKQDHEITERVFAAMETLFASAAGPSPEQVSLLVEYLLGYVERCHNQKEEQHLFPRLQEKGMPRDGGPLGVMLQEHARAQELLSQLVPLGAAFAAGAGGLPELRAAFDDYAALCKDHFWKENDILYPLAQRLLSEQEAGEVVRGIEAVEASLGGDTRARYYRSARTLIEQAELRDLSFGLDRDVLAAILNTLPVELSFIDHEDRVRYFSHEHGEKIFGRTRGAIGMAVQNCHPPKSLHLVNQILADFKAGRRDVAEFWIEMNGRMVHIRYWPVRGDDGRYLGTLETVQDVSAIRALSGERRLLDPAAGA
jgi:PAS domain S-box-containing protein